MDEKSLQVMMGLIMHSGDAKSHAMEAIQAAKEYDFESAEQSLNDAKESLIKAHQSQTEMLTKEAQGNSTEITLLTIHSQDHLMTGITFTDLAKEIVDLYRVIDKK
ncbi:PTS lactose/cellobiose transporter subunit IIA [Vagococcus luciliae]|uniref:Lichenan-specific phosphotransferase enzyme IIA component n=1 Tax=Vagococcus luciliae TaxID=2920380 RepID=A0ABY5NXW2_9ENTE|nr:PTS lactose/cellobiose transporter subunit IIA [Vagococcus luciliae]UUV98489.1 Lichenan-specific phosphotransferase enzyme IIA component [Vagococcus luciliae]